MGRGVGFKHSVTQLHINRGFVFTQATPKYNVCYLFNDIKFMLNVV